MQTFLPYPSFSNSAKVLDDKRLRKQIVEGYQILKAITLPTYGWQNHPAVNQWRGWHVALMDYIWHMNQEYRTRQLAGEKAVDHASYLNAFTFFIEHYEKDVRKYTKFCHNPIFPFWLGLPSYHASHRSNLLRKDPDWYGRWGWEEADNLPYVWPSKMEEFSNV